MDHEYQLVLQLAEQAPLTSLDIEDDIAAALGNAHDDESLPHLVDGNSQGGGTIEFFMHTNEPRAACELLKPLLVQEGLMEFATIAYRKLSEQDFYVIWPIDYQGTFQV